MIYRTQKKEEMGFDFMPLKLKIKGYDYDKWYKEKLNYNSDEFIDISDMPPLEGDEEEVNEGNRIKISILNKLLTRLPMLLAQTKAGNNSYKLKNEIRQILYLLYQHNKITKKVYNNLIKSL